MQLRLAVRTLYGATGADDDALGDRLVDLVRTGVRRGQAPAVAVCVRDDRVDLLALGALAEAKVPPGPFLAGLTRSELAGSGPPLAVGVMGTFQLRRRPGDAGVPVALVFLEWADCRWWQWQTLIEASGRGLREETEVVARATDGDPKPNRLGGWWSLGRRRAMSVRLERTEPTLVH